MDFSLFVAFFPQVNAGPIDRAQKLLPQIQSDRIWKAENFYSAWPLLVMGFFKKVVIADTVRVMVDRIYSLKEPTLALLFIGALPRTDWLEGIVERDRAGFVVTGPALARASDGRVAGWPLVREPYLLETNVPGMFAAGDVRSRSVKRIASGVGM